MRIETHNNIGRLHDECGTTGYVRLECCACFAPVEVTDGQRIDGRTKVQPVYDYERSGNWHLVHKIGGCER